ncbi:uncharacterized protein LOC126743883 [Anthonomus grandis grandis]|uniref:uncharacterized protein LOC126743883 n=1 Tax=Anthonomus grandis grandis TaxID=2921223 RepID=UPI0021659409|nr:uncharacterized protein LOC126743883 [Anthonomus grandis grandis]
MSKVTEDVVILDRGNYTTCTVHLHGGTILSYRVKNKEILYMKRKSDFTNFSPIRGGIKVAFPYFGRRINGPKNGFVKYVPWMLVKGPDTTEDGNVEATFAIKETEYTKAIWSYTFKLQYRLTLCTDELKIDLQVENTSKHFPFLFSILLHSIFKMEDVTKCQIVGLGQSKYVDVDAKHPPHCTPMEPNPENDVVKISKPTSRMFLDTPPDVEIFNVDSKGLKLKITSAHPLTETLIYSPWVQERKCSEFDRREYTHCLGVSNGRLSSDIRLEPKETWEAHFKVEVVNEAEEKRIQELANLLDNPLSLFNESCKTTEVYNIPLQ